MKVVVVGAGVSGLVAAWVLARQHDVVLLEAADHPGGHARTVDVEADGVRRSVDTGFVVFNERTYPGFVRILRHLGVASRPSDMSFGVRDETTGLEYCGSRRWTTLFAQRRNLVRPSFWRMLRDVVRFGREAPALLETGADDPSLAEYLRRGRYSRAFVEQHLVPMAAAVWSAAPQAMERFPARYLVPFFRNHGFLSLRDRPAWLTVEGGSRAYVSRLSAALGDRLRLRTPVRRVLRRPDRVEVTTADGATHVADHVVLAVHADQALRMLADPGDAEREVLSSFGYATNDVVLHTDASLLPRARRAWASWNWHRTGRDEPRATVSYLANLLHGFPGPPWFLLTLNRPDAVDPARILMRIAADHPQYTPAAVAAQGRHGEISGTNRTHYAGAHWGYGFHEDGVQSALAVTRWFGLGLPA